MKKNRYTGSWCAASIKRARDLWPDNTAADIAAKLSREFKRTFTRSSVIGKAARNGFPRKDNPAKSFEAPLLRLVPAPAQVPLPQPKAIQPSSLTTYDPSRLGMALEDVQDIGGCRWPVSHARPHRFCGDRISHRSYCAEHQRRSVNSYVIAEAAE